jgi:hypothetical protein
MEVPINKIIETYVKIRDKKEEIYRNYKDSTAELEEQMKLLKHKLLELSKETGATTFSTPDYTAYRTVKNRYWTNDWESFYDFMHENGAMGLLEKRIHQTNMKEFIDENPNLHPPGLNVDSEYEFTIKRK